MVVKSEGADLSFCKPSNDMRIKIDLKKIKEAAQRRDDENWVICSLLKQWVDQRQQF